MEQVREVLRVWIRGGGYRRVAALSGLDRKTVRRYVEAALAVGVTRGGGEDQLCDEVIGAVVGLVRPARPEGHGEAWESLVPLGGEIAGWVKQDYTIVKINQLLERKGVVVPYRTLVRFCAQRCGFTGRRPKETVRLVDGEPGAECQIDFGEMGLLPDPVTGRRRRTWALIFTAVYSRHMFVWLTHSQTLEAVVAGCEAAWEFFDGVFKVVIPDNMGAVVAKADAVNPVLTQGWLDYAQHQGFVTDTTRVRKPTDKARVERPVPFVRKNFWAGESFIDITDAQARVQRWCTSTAGLRIHGTTHARPAEVFTAEEQALLLPRSMPYDRPVFRDCKVHRDFHIEVCKSLYSIPKDYIGQVVQVRADSTLVKVYFRGKLIKTHPRMPAGKPSTDRDDLPEEKSIYAMRDLDRLAGDARRHGEHVGTYAQRLLEGELPWTKMRQVYRLLGLARRYGSDTVNTACERALRFDVVNVTKIESMLKQGAETAPAPQPRPVAAVAGRFARDPGEYAVRKAHLRLVHNADTQPALPGLDGEQAR